jgi:multidrug efflux pump subunit AcrA (membrane-fusion protein)
LANRGVASAQKLEDTITSEAMFEATVRAGEAAVENARVVLNYTTIRAPITGRTGSVSFKRGNIVKAVDTAQIVLPLVTITQLRPRVPGGCRSGKVFQGKVLFVSDVLEPDTRRTKVRIAFDNPDRALKPGMFANVSFAAPKLSRLVVPTSALLMSNDRTSVFAEVEPE